MEIAPVSDVDRGVAAAAKRPGATYSEIEPAATEKDGKLGTTRTGSPFSVRETHGILWRPDIRIHATSEGLGWLSLFASAQRAVPFEASYHAVHDHLLILHLDGPVAVRQVIGKSQERRTFRPGSLKLVPSGLDFGVRPEGILESVHVYLRDAVLREVAAELLGGDPAHVELVPRLGHQDHLVEQLVLGIREALTAPDPSSAVYADQLAHMLGARLLHDHSNRTPQPAEPPRSGLTRTQLARAIEFMDANLPERLSLGEIAGAACLSSGHFIRQFKASVGMAPHRYIIRLRLDRAKRLLRETDRSIAQIAFECGFSHQEHMTRFFGEFSGTTPAVFRRKERTTSLIPAPG
jgi:AraC family transcriptional regulator